MTDSNGGSDGDRGSDGDGGSDSGSSDARDGGSNDASDSASNGASESAPAMAAATATGNNGDSDGGSNGGSDGGNNRGSKGQQGAAMGAAATAKVVILAGSPIVCGNDANNWNNPFWRRERCKHLFAGQDNTVQYIIQYVSPPKKAR